MNRSSLLTASFMALTLTLQAQDTDPGRDLATRVAKASGVDAWAQVATFSFTWRHLPGPKDRGYVWDVDAETVKVTVGESTVEVPVAGFGADAKPSKAQAGAHRAFVNDSFWALCGLHMAWDWVDGFDDLGQVEVPTFPKLGKRRALRVRYSDTGGYTPGDHYVLYLGDDDRPVAWAFHKAGSKEPKLVTTWEGYQTIGGVTLPTRFAKPDGTVLIGIEGIGVSQRTRRPASRPTSRPADTR